MAAKDNWNREELIVALNLYWKIPYNKISGNSNSVIKVIASIIDRTPAALAYNTDPEGYKPSGKLIVVTNNVFQRLAADPRLNELLMLGKKG